MAVNFHINPLQPALFVLLNNFDMAIILGCPLMVLSNQIISRRAGTSRILTRNERIIILTAVAQVVIMAAVTLFVYAGSRTIGTYDIWNTIYIIGLLIINASMLVSLGCMALFGKKD